MKILFSVLALAALAGTAPALAQTAAPATAPAAKFGLDTPIQDIVANDAARAALDASLPGVSTHTSYEMFKSMTLRQVAGYAPDQLTPEKLAAAEKALAAVK